MSAPTSAPATGVVQAGRARRPLRGRGAQRQELASTVIVSGLSRDRHVLARRRRRAGDTSNRAMCDDGGVAMLGYPPEYFAHFSGGSARSAAIVLPIVKSLVTVTSVADFGCGTGAWLAVWQRLGLHDVIGCDGPSVDAAALLDSTRLVAVDLTRAVRLGRRFDLVQSLEVAEHLPADAARTFVETLVSHAPVVLFSAAPPGQGGEHHVNEQPLEYWRALFRQHGFQALDALRPRLVGEKRVEPWYRYNSLLFVDRSCLARLDANVRSGVVPDGVPLREYAPLGVTIRNRVLKHVPEPVVTRIAAGVRQVMARWRG